nr:piggyBac transposable element-derived protein 4-like [Leptinotarsa decemlineata]
MSYEEEQKRLKHLWEGFGASSDDDDDDLFIGSNSDGEDGMQEEVGIAGRGGEHPIEETEYAEEGTVHAEEELENAISDSDTEYGERERESTTDDSRNGADSNRDGNRYFLDKNKSKWAKFPNRRNVRTRSENIVIHLPGVKGIARQKKTAIDCWLLFFTEDMLDDIVRYTNVKLGNKATKYNTSHQYLVKETDKMEIKAVMGLLYLTGLYKAHRQNMSDLWNTDESGIELFRTTMSLQRFYILLQSLRFDNKHNRDQRKEIDKLAPIIGIFEKFVDNCKIHYSPSEYLTVDEKLEPFRGRVSFLQYMPKKPAKYGLKVFALVDAKTYYCLNMEVYVGTQPDGPYRQSNSPEDIVERLIEPVSGTKRNITFDNWFTSYPLMMNLLERHKLTSVGTVRKNKRQIPAVFLNITTREPRSSVFAFRENITAVSYVPKKSRNVILFSTLHHDDAIIDESGDKKLPEIIHFYNSTRHIG